MEIIGTNFTLSVGDLRLRIALAVEEMDAPQTAKARPPDHMRAVPEDEYAV